LAQDPVGALSNARERLVAHCHVVAGRLAEGWKPWSTHDVDILVQVGEAITVLDRLMKQESTIVSPPSAASSAGFALT
jgi:hypothetical protein